MCQGTRPLDTRTDGLHRALLRLLSCRRCVILFRESTRQEADFACSVFHPRYIAADHIVRYVRAMQNSLGSVVCFARIWNFDIPDLTDGAKERIATQSVVPAPARAASFLVGAAISRPLFHPRGALQRCSLFSVRYSRFTELLHAACQRSRQIRPFAPSLMILVSASLSL